MITIACVANMLTTMGIVKRTVSSCEVETIDIPDPKLSLAKLVDTHRFSFSNFHIL